jgi:UDP-N-acetylglucosamine:LPS N-acetylglucosamine transferase
VQVPRFKETLSPLDDLGVLVQLVRVIRAERFTVVHTHSAMGGFLGRLAAWLCRVPVIVHTFHGFSFHD